EFVALVGALTALMAGIIALTQTDIKKVLAYSTVSQLGYMFVALGVTAYSSAMFHVMTHAFFKALLFLGAGCVIHAMSGEQNMRKMGGLRKHLPITFITMAIATAAIVGFPPFAGFFSKDEILSAAYSHSMVLFVILAVTSVLTAAYMFRLFFLTFFGEFRGTKHQLEHLHESPKSMTVPLLILMVLSALGGFLGIPEALGGKHFLAEYFNPVFGMNTRIGTHEVSHLFEYSLMGISVLMIIFVSRLIQQRYNKKVIPAEQPEAKMSWWYKLSLHKFYIDELYDKVFVKPLNAMSNFFFGTMEKKVIDGAVNGSGQTVYFFSSLLKNVQSGNITFYVLMMVVGIVAILFFSLIKTIAF
ncbi:MAG: proton-conducting transporter membrane subunit, partial [Bacteroidota bacterium]